MRKLLLLILIILIGMNLSLYAKKRPAKLLQKNLEQWHQFKWQGIIQVQSSAFSMRKNFVLAKDSTSLRLDVLDSGIIGLQAKPFLILYLKDKIVIDAPTIEQLKGLDLNWFVPPGSIEKLMHFADSLQLKQQEIISNRKIITANTIFSFDKKYRLSNIKSTDFNIEANIIYNRRNYPTKLLIKLNGEQMAELQINEREYKDIKIVPLEFNPGAIDYDKILHDIPLNINETEPE